MAFCPVTLEGDGCADFNVLHPVVYTANHGSYVDSLVLLSVLPAGVIFTVKKELLQAAIVGACIKKLGYITVDRLDVAKSLDDKQHIEEALLQGQSLFIFPEGTFTYATGLRPFKMGAFVIAAETNTPICPIALHGTRAILRGEQWLSRPGAIKVVIGALITPKGQDWNEAVRLHTMVRNEIALHCGEPKI